MSDDLPSRSTIKQEHREGPPQPEDIAPHFPQLEILDLIGHGGMGVVYKARQKTLDRLVALKVLLPSPDRPETFAQRFSREAQSLARLQHANIVMVHDSGEAGEFYYFVMEYVDGANLRQMMAAGDLSPQQALAIVPFICDALQYAHDEGIAHRDIKPENILIDSRGRVKIADFGLAKLLSRRETDYTLTSPQQVMGTMHYMAPEQVEHPETVDHRADIYALGVVIYEMLTGELPIGRFPLPSEKAPANSGVDARLDEVVLRALEKEPDRRYQSATEIKTDLQHASWGLHPVPLQPGIYAASGMHATAQQTHAAATPPPGSAAGGLAGTVAQAGADLREIAVGRRNPTIAYLLWLLCFGGVCGAHRAYAGKWITAVLWFVTGGVFLIGQLIDLFLIPEMIRRENWKRDVQAAGTRAMMTPQPGVAMAAAPAIATPEQQSAIPTPLSSTTPSPPSPPPGPGSSR